MGCTLKCSSCFVEAMRAGNRAVNKWSACVDARRDLELIVGRHNRWTSLFDTPEQVFGVFMDFDVCMDVFAEVCILFCPNKFDYLRAKQDSLEIWTCEVFVCLSVWIWNIPLCVYIHILLCTHVSAHQLIHYYLPAVTLQHFGFSCN